MAPTSAVPYLLQIVVRQGTARACSHKTALPHAPLIFALPIFCPVGRGPHTTLRFTMTPAELISTSQRGGITLQMLALACPRHCLSLIEMCGTIYLNGVVLRIRKLFILS